MTARKLAQGGKDQREKSRWEEKERGPLDTEDTGIPRRTILSKGDLVGHLVKNLGGGPPTPSFQLSPVHDHKVVAQW